MSKIVVIEGLDGCGKTTQLRLLEAALAREGAPPLTLKFPRYQSEGSALVRGYLDGRFSAVPDDINCYAATVFFSADRYISFVNEWRGAYEGDGIILLDRYTTSNAVFQTPKLPFCEWDGYLEWLYDFEYVRMGLPAPDLVVFLDIDAELSETLLMERYGGDGGKKDINERDIEYQRRCREAARYCAAKGGWKSVQCAKDGALRPIDDIHSEILSIVRSIL